MIANQAPAQPSSPMKLVANILFGLFFVAVLALAAGYMYFQSTGWQFFEIASGSMEPAIMEGDVVAVKKIEPWNVKAGDVIAFKQSNIPVPIIHRVVGVQSAPDIRSVFQDRQGNPLGEKMQYSPRRYFTKGDANTVNDGGPVSQDQLIGIQRSIVPQPFASVLVLLNRSNLMRAGVVLIGAFIAWQLVDIAREGLSSRKPQQVAQNTREGSLG